MKRINLSVAVAAMVMACWSASAVPIVTQDFAGGQGTWVLNKLADGSWAGPPASAGSATINAGVMDIDSGAANGGNVADFFYSGADFDGNYTAGGLAVDGIQGVSFDFYNGGGTAIPELSVYLVAASGRVWYHSSTEVTSTSGWGTYGVNLSYDSLDTMLAGDQRGEWFTLGGDNLAAWQTDLATVSGIGFRMLYDTTANQAYGFDDIIIQDDPYYTMVPEPQTYAMLGFAFLSMGVTFRRKLEASFASLKAMLS